VAQRHDPAVWVQILAGAGLKSPFCKLLFINIFAPAYFQTF
jgi:hypothetical protein